MESTKRLLYVSNNAYDTVVLTADDGEGVLSEVAVTPQVMADFLDEGDQPELWDAGHVEIIGKVSDYGEVLAVNGTATSDRFKDRVEFFSPLPEPSEKTIQREIRHALERTEPRNRMKFELLTEEVRGYTGDQLKGWIIRFFDRARSRGVRFETAKEFVQEIRRDLSDGYISEVLRQADEGYFG